MILRILHAVGLTNLSDANVDKYYETRTPGLSATTISLGVMTRLAREAIEIVAPEELPFFRAYSEAFFRDPSKLLVQKSEKDDILGFGKGDLVELVTGPALALAAIALSFLKDAARDALKSKAEASIGGLIDLVIKAVRTSSSKREVAQDWTWKVTPGEIKQLRDLLLEDARRLKLSETKAAQLADAVVARIVERLP